MFTCLMFITNIDIYTNLGYFSFFSYKTKTVILKKMHTLRNWKKIIQLCTKWFIKGIIFFKANIILIFNIMLPYIIFETTIVYHDVGYFNRFLLKSYFNISFISTVSLLLLSPLRHYEIEMEKVGKMKFANKTKMGFCIPITFNNPLKAYFSNKKHILQSKCTPHKL